LLWLQFSEKEQEEQEQEEQIHPVEAVVEGESQRREEVGRLKACFNVCF
jgi:hypothetical protein